MLSIPITRPPTKDSASEFIADRSVPVEDRARLSIFLDLLSSGWTPAPSAEAVQLIPPNLYTKEAVRSAMAAKRQELIDRDRPWIDGHLPTARENLASGLEALQSEVQPEIEVCRSRSQRDLFRVYRYYWSSPYSEYVGRRIRFIIRDGALSRRPVIGIAALGSSIIHMPARDDFVGWTAAERTNNIIKAMDAYVVGALPPYSDLLGGKLVAMLLGSNEVRDCYRRKYESATTVVRKRKESAIAALFTTSLFGRSSQYNRLRCCSRSMWVHIGYTRGFGSLHISERTFRLCQELVLSDGCSPSYRFGAGPSWRVRLIRQAGRCLGIDADFLLRHSYRRGVYYLPMCSNALEVLRGETNDPVYFDRPLQHLVEHWRRRWLSPRRLRPEVQCKVSAFSPTDFVV